MEMNKNITKINENVLNFVTGGAAGPASKYDPGDKVRYRLNGKEEVGIIFEAIYFAEDSHWKYQIKDLNGRIVCELLERDILGIA